MPYRVEEYVVRSGKSSLSAALAAAEGGEVWGIKISSPEAAACCAINIDPRDSGTAAIEVALTCELPPDGTTFLLASPHVDAVAAAAVSLIRRESGDRALLPADVQERIRLVIEAEDIALHWRPSAIPSRTDPWPIGGISQLLAAMDAAVKDSRKPLQRRVEQMVNWLLTGAEPADARETVEDARLALIAALESGDMSVDTAARGRIAVVETAERIAVRPTRTVGLAKAPVIVVHHSEGGARRTFVLIQHRPRDVHLKDALRELSERERGWSGSTTMGRSPRHAPSRLSIAAVVDVVAGHLRDDS